MSAAVEFLQTLVFLVVTPLVAALGLVLLLLTAAADAVLGRGKRAPRPKVIVITGATAGIGEALALHYAKPGVTLGLTGRNAARLKAVAAACEERGAAVETLSLDVTERAALSDWLLALDGRSPVDWVVANAGVSEETVGLERDVVAATRALFAINADGVFNTVLPLLPAMKARGRGRLVLMASQAATMPLAACPAYCASKAAVRAYGESLRGLVYRDGVRVNVVCPGFVESPMTKILTHHLPGLMTMPAAVRCIAAGLEADAAVIGFPFWFSSCLSLAGRVLPPALFHALARRRAFLPTANYLKARRASAKKAA